LIFPLSLLAWRGGPVRLLRLLAVAVIVLPLAVFATGGAIAWQNVQQDAWDKTGRLVDLVYESTSRLFDTHRVVLDQAQALVAGLDDAAITAHQADLHARLAAMLPYMPHVLDIFVVSRGGRALVDAVKYPGPAGNDLTGRDYVQYFMQGGTGLFISRPGLRKVDGRPFFALAIRRAGADGSFNGVIAASINPAFFETFFARAEAAYSDFPGRIMTLRRTSDGALLVRSPPGLAPAEAPEPLATMFRQATADSGRLESRSPLDGDTRLVAWRRLPQVGIVIVTSITRAAVVRNWIAAMVPHLWFGVPATIALFTISLLAIQRTHQAEAAAAEAEAERIRREQAEEVARQGQKMEALGKLTGGVAHDFNNLLAVILGSAELAKTRPPEKVGRMLDNILHAGQRAATLTRQLLSFARRQPLAPRVVDLHAGLPHILEVLRPALGITVAIDVRVAEDVWLIEVDPHEWEIALLNIAVNARDAMPDGGTFVVDVVNRTLAPGEIAAAPHLEGPYVAVSLRDTGSGMPEDVAGRAFEPFFTTKEIGRGTGLGLSQVYGFTRQAGGAAMLDSTPGQGTTVTLFLPRSQKPLGQAGDAAEASYGGGEGSSRRILLVEDEAAVATLVTDMLQSLGYEVVALERPRAALDWLAGAQRPVHLLLSDVTMPGGMNGMDLVRHLRIRMPALPVLLMSGNADVLAEPRDGVALLRKPFGVEQLAAAVRVAIGEFPRIVVDNTRVG
jgi:two-component system NtrC family sensor kinase